MGAVTNLVFLTLVGLSVAWENLPNIPANRRAEYYLLHNDGAYKFGYDTGVGASHMAKADANNEVRGSYMYESPEGPVTLTYTAGRGGFIPNPLEVASSVTSNSAKSNAAKSHYSSSVSHSAVAHSKTGLGSSSHLTTSSLSSEKIDPHYNENADASYAFDINTDEYKRQESSDAKGNVMGRYSFTGKDGNKVAVRYSAGAGKGFVVESHEGLNTGASPVSTYSSNTNAYIAPAVSSFKTNPIIPVAKPYTGPIANIISSGPFLDGSYSFSYQTPELDRVESSDASGLVKGSYSYVAGDGARRTVNYNAGALLGFVPQGDGIIPPVPAIPASTAFSGYSGSLHSTKQSTGSFSSTDDLANTGDSSYAFGYMAGDHQRTESSDPSGNVQGQYSYTAPDGLSRTVKYTAGANKGFVVEQSQSGVASTLTATKPSINTYSAHQNIAKQTYDSSALKHTFNSAATKHSLESASKNNDASYSFSYQTDSHGRQESADEKGNVRGSYSFKADDGVSRQVDYTAGSNTGFIAKGAHLPKNVVATVPVSFAPASTLPVQQSTVNTYIPPSQSSTLTKTSVSSVVPDGSYSFSYNTGDSSRQESSDNSGSVSGQFSFIADDGVSRSVQYQAGANTGFLAQGSHLPSVASTKTASNIASSSSWTNAPATTLSKTLSSSSEQKGDSSYSYSYQTDSSSKQEKADANGNVVGTFSYLGGDGISRTLNYVAGPESGFLATGAHLPVAPSAESGVVVAKSSLPQATSYGNIHNSGAASWKTGTVAGSSWTSSSVANPTNFVLHKYLPPESALKYGYILDTKQ